MGRTEAERKRERERIIVVQYRKEVGRGERGSERDIMVANSGKGGKEREGKRQREGGRAERGKKGGREEEGVREIMG